MIQFLAILGNHVVYNSGMSKENIILFSVPSPEILEKIQTYIFSKIISHRIMSYLPSEGNDLKSIEKYTPIWRQYAAAHGVDFQIVDNSQRGEAAQKEIAKLDQSNILIITGGNTFKLMNHLRESGLDNAIVEFHNRGGIIVAFSAGAIVLSPSLETATHADNDQVGLADMKGLGLIDFLVLPHADNKQEQIEKLKSEGKNFQAINNSEFKIV